MVRYHGVFVQNEQVRRIMSRYALDQEVGVGTVEGVELLLRQGVMLLVVVFGLFWLAGQGGAVAQLELFAMLERVLQ